MDYRKSTRRKIRPWISFFSFFAVGAGLFFFNGRHAEAQAVNLTANVQPSSTVSLLIQNSYRWYENVDALDPITPAGAENASVTTPSAGTGLRLRMNIGNIGGVTVPAGATFELQYANAASGPWSNVASATAWGFLNNPSVPDGQIVTTLLLASSTAGESYGISNPSAASPAPLASGTYGEWDWSLVNVSASTSQNWFFRMIYASGTLLNGYSSYPGLTATTTASSSNNGGGPTPPSSPAIQVGGGGTGFYSTSTSTFPVTSLLPPALRTADFNGEGRVDIIDLSILLYYYHRSDSAALRYDLNGDGIVNFPDVSILMYYWTG